MIIKDNITEILKNSPINEVSINCTTITIFPLKEIKKINLSKPSHIDNDWIIIGDEDLCGDLICINSNSESLPVYLVPIDDELEFEYISSSLNNLIEILLMLKEISIGRDTPVKYEQNPLPEDELNQFLQKVKLFNPDCELQFWSELFEV
ncbi:MAG TPA: hypothetical protein VHO66_10650 [Ruminiclostridium sp.]|nr:hypothetical protein [Ruminiclostridium sp.]